MLVVMGLEDMLTDLGCEIVGIAARVDQALNMLDTETFDAVVLDVNLNGRASYPIADALIVRNVPFVFSTGYETASLSARYPNCRAVQKPFAAKELGSAIEAVLMTGSGA